MLCPLLPGGPAGGTAGPWPSLPARLGAPDAWACPARLVCYRSRSPAQGGVTTGAASPSLEGPRGPQRPGGWSSLLTRATGRKPQATQLDREHVGRNARVRGKGSCSRAQGMGPGRGAHQIGADADAGTARAASPAAGLWRTPRDRPPLRSSQPHGGVRPAPPSCARVWATSTRPQRATSQRGSLTDSGPSGA